MEGPRWSAGWNAQGLSSAMFLWPQTGDSYQPHHWQQTGHPGVYYFHPSPSLHQSEPLWASFPTSPKTPITARCWTEIYTLPLTPFLALRHTRTKREWWAAMCACTHTQHRKRGCVKAILQPDMVWSCSLKGSWLTGYPAFWKPLMLQPHHTTCCCWPMCQEVHIMMDTLSCERNH